MVKKEHGRCCRQSCKKKQNRKFSDASKYFAIAGEAIKPKMYTSGLYSGARGVYAAEGGQLAEARWWYSWFFI